MQNNNCKRPCRRRDELAGAAEGLQRSMSNILVVGYVD
jgi:hypothetical protein